MKSRKYLTVIAVYSMIIVAALSLATLRMRAQTRLNQPPSSDGPIIRPIRPRPGTAPQRYVIPAPPSPTPARPEAALNPRFTLSTNRAYGSDEAARIWVSYQDIESLDFRLYRVNDPMGFFRRLGNLREMGEREFEEVTDRGPTILEHIREFKDGVYKFIKRYVRGQLRRHSRTAFNDKYRSGEQRQLKVADYANIPLLDSDGLTLRGTWRQTLAPLN